MYFEISIFLGMFIPITYIAMYILGASLRPGYGHISDSVSELLTPGAPNKPLLIIIQTAYALLHIGFGIGILQFIHRSGHTLWTGNLGAWMIIGVGVATIGTVIFPQDAKGTPVTAKGKTHITLVFAFLVPFSFLSTLLIGIWTNQAGMFPCFDVYSYITVALIILSGIMGGKMVETPYAGLVERISALIVHQWLFVLAVAILSH